MLQALGVAMTELVKVKHPDPVHFVGESLAKIAHVYDSQFHSERRQRLPHKRLTAEGIAADVQTFHQELAEQ